MNIYILNLIVVYFSSTLALVYSRKQEETVTLKPKPNIVFVWIAIISMLLVSGLRWQVGTDFIPYYNIINRTKMLELKDIFMLEEPGFHFTTWVITKIFGDPQIVLIVFAFFTIAFIANTIKDYSTRFELSMFLFITTMAYYNSFNIVRQWFASALIFFAYKYLVKQENVKYFICIFIAALFHTSALLLLPIYFIIKAKPWSKVTVAIFICFLGSYFFYEQFLTFIFNFIKVTKYGEYSMFADSTIGEGANIIRVLVAGVPVVLSFIFYKKIKNNRKDIGILVNFSLVNLLFVILATKHWAFARINIYFNIYNVLLIPEFINIVDKRSRALIYFIIFTLFLLHMIILLPVEGDYLPYRAIWGKW